MTRLASSIAAIKAHYDVVVIGSGYGGGVAASRMARAGRSVCLLERGAEIAIGDFPNNLKEAASQFQLDGPHGHVGPVTGLYDLRINHDMSVVVGCGLGGTSLINASVSLLADPRVFDDPSWPEQIRREAQSVPSRLLQSTGEESADEGSTATDTNTLREGYRRAIAMLKPQRYPEHFPALEKLAAHRQSAAHMGEKFCRTPINVTFQDGVNHVGVEQSACVLCGDCISGCNYGAKNTTAMNYLPDARNHGAELFTEIAVSRLERQNDRWCIFFQPVTLGRDTFDAPELFIHADIVILAAGTLGSTEILLRSRDAGLPLSDHLGKSFTGNGDVLAFSYNNDQAIHAIGYGETSPDELPAVGPCITGVIDTRDTPSLDDGMVIEEGSLPGALAPLLPGLLKSAATITGQDSDDQLIDNLKEQARIYESMLRGAYHGAMDNTQVYLVMAHDDSDGEMVLRDDRLRIDWDGIGDRLLFKTIGEKVARATEALGGTYLPNPLWNELLDNPLVTVHPLGGCGMADSADQGVVNHKSQVYSSRQGNGVHDGLYVCDGAVMPRSLGVNPLLTISALAERSCALIASDHGWDQGYSATSTPPPNEPEAKLGVQFTETMRGYFTDQEKSDFDRGAQIGEADNSPFMFTLTVLSDDLESMLSSEAHSAKMVGTVIAPALSDRPLTITRGRFNLFVRDPDRVNTRRMCYRMTLTAVDGRQWYFDGFKYAHNDRLIDLWSDTTTLFITLHDGPTEQAPVHGKGILKIRPDDFAKQITTIKARNPTDHKEGLLAVARFGRFFAGAMAETYLGPFAPIRLHDPDAAPRSQRMLNVGEPKQHEVITDDGGELRLTRYQGGTKGPVILSHGFGVSSRIFSLDTIDTNLLEYLYTHQYDVWLLDYRASIELPAANSAFSGDEIARYDYPAAVAKVRSVSGAESVQFVVHCFGSTTFFMAMLIGLEGVRSAVASQIATHIKTPLLSRLKAGLYLPRVLDALGVDSLTAYVDSHANWQERLYDNALRFYPVEFEEHSSSAVDRRITFMYGQLWELDQLNTATHDTLHELFGVANIRCFEHLAKMSRTGHLVDFDGGERYLPHAKRLAIPIRFIHGAENSAFLPESTRFTFDQLRRLNGDLYSRHVIPDYGHIDCIFGKNAAKDVYPLILEHLEQT